MSSHLVSDPSFLITFGLTVDVMSLSPSSIAYPAPAISKAPSNSKKVRSHHGPPPSELQSSQSENRGALPIEQHHAGFDTRAQKDVSPPEHGTSESAGSSSHSSRNRPIYAESITGQISGSTPSRINHQQGDDLHLEHVLPPSSYEYKTTPAVPSAKEGSSSRPSTGTPREVHKGSTTKSGNVHPSSLRRVWAHRYFHFYL